MRKIAITCWILAAFLVVIGWPFRGHLFWHLGIEGPSLLQEITSEAGLEQALTDDHATIFLNLEWSLENQVFRKDVNEFACNWRYSRQSPYSHFYLIDLSDVYGKLKQRIPYVHDWMESDRRISKFTRRGMGGIVFTNHGKVIDFVPDDDYFNRTVLTLPELAKRSFE